MLLEGIFETTSTAHVCKISRAPFRVHPTGPRRLQRRHASGTPRDPPQHASHTRKQKKSKAGQSSDDEFPRCVTLSDE